MKIRTFVEWTLALLACAGVMYAQEFRIAPNVSLPAGSNFYNVSIASDTGSGFLLTWANTYQISSTTYYRNYACRISRTGEMLDSAAICIGDSYWKYYCPHAVFAGGNWIVAVNQGGLYEYVGAIRVTPAGRVLDSPAVNICNSDRMATVLYPAIATNGQKILCVMGAGGGGLFGSIFDANLNVVVDRFVIMEQVLSHAKPRIASNGDNFFVTFVHFENYVYNIKLAVVNPDGQILSIQTVNETAYDNRGYWGLPTIATLNGITYVFYFHTPHLYVRRYSSDGQPIDARSVKLYTSPEFELVMKQQSSQTPDHYFDVVWANGCFHFFWPKLADNRILAYSFRPDLSTMNLPVSLSGQCQITFSVPRYEQSFSIVRASSFRATILTAWIDGREASGTRAYGCLVDAKAYTALEEGPHEIAVPEDFSLCQNYPNPFNPSTTIQYALPHRSHVKLSLFNTLGQTVAVLVNGVIDAGYHDVQFNANNLASGVYFCRLSATPLALRDLIPAGGRAGEAGSFVDVKKLCLVR